MKFTETSFLDVTLEANFAIKNITDDILVFVKDCGLKEGILNVFVVGSTASVTSTEYEPGTSKDLKDLFEKLAPAGKSYEHHKTWNDGNGHSHLQASVLGPSVSLPVKDGNLLTGTWQQIVLINHDIRKRSRQAVLTAIGEFY
jgi:secondary thiamine-phosphate synthase enzyme